MSSNFDFDPLKVAGSGHYIRVTAGEALSNRELVYLNADGSYYRSRATGAATMPVQGLAIGGIAVGTTGMILIKGFIGLSTWTWVVGGALYASNTLGALSQTGGTIRQQVGYAVLATQIWFEPQLDGGSLSLLDYEVQTGIIAEPATVSRGNGHTVVVHNETEERDFIWSRTDLNTKWSGVELL